MLLPLPMRYMAKTVVIRNFSMSHIADISIPIPCGLAIRKVKDVVKPYARLS